MSCHRPGLYLLAGVASFVVGSAIAMCSTGGCTPQEWATAAPILQGVTDVGCATLAGILDPALTAACPGLDGLVSGAISAAEKGAAPPPGTSVEIVATDAGQAHALVYKHDAKGRHLIGHGPCNPHHASPADAGTDASLPLAPAVLPVTVVVVDAGAEGGR